MKIKYFFLNLKLNKKMLLGFSAMFIIMISIMASGLFGLRHIQERVDKNAVSIKLLESLAAAKLSRISYELSGEAAYVKQNKVAMAQLSQHLENLFAFTWSESGLDILNRSKRALKNCFEDWEVFDSLMTKKVAMQQRLDSQDFYTKSTSLNRWSYDIALQPELGMMISQFSFAMSDLDTLLSEYLKSPTENKLHTLQTRIDESLALGERFKSLLSSERQSYLDNIIKEIKGYASDIVPYRQLNNEVLEVSSKLAKNAAELAHGIHDINALMQQRVVEVSTTVEWQMEIVALVGIGIGILLAWLITRSITLPIQDTLRLAEQIAKGDLTHDLKTERRDELGSLMQSIYTMNNNLKTIIHDVREGVDSVARSSSEIASGNIDLSSRTEEQAAAVVETAASMEELTSTIALNAANANDALKLSELAAKKANEGCQISQVVIESMKNVRTSSHRISEITSVINGIAFQTNILALNAAVEAARAGEQGKGFAVVAGEVRNLAQRSARSAKEIEELITDSVKQVDSGFALVERSGIAIADIEQSVIRMRDIMADIALATSEQSRGVTQIAQAMTEMDTTTQQNAALVEESSVAASSLEEQALKLEEAISVFHVSHEYNNIPQTLMGIRKMSVEAVKQESNHNNWVKF
ncbi:methyl-accepting chemotaxis protein [Citrobacter werkmanii]|uniref:methyl-accepting chemotaxis protein n=1 Tax=Citrobacter werkmanii TaxID=67827 RepID=UPI002954C4B0|nr:methyl-accepting chemotaxis protein [Citrobacter werkmanii]MDV7072241.1 methyl-accepting chemotaxis protein [Citrobacter werkmanii]